MTEKGYTFLMSKVIILTGATSGIGLCIAKHLCRRGYVVYGFGRNDRHTKEELKEYINNKAFIGVYGNLLDTNWLVSKVTEIEKNNALSCVINNAGCAYYGLFETMNPKKISEMVRTNLEVPMIITNLCLRNLKENHGHIIDISSVTAKKTNPHGVCYGATKAGLTSFGNSLFDEARKYGVKVTTIHPDMTKSELYRNADFCQDDDKNAYIEPYEIAKAIDYILDIREGVLITDLTITPQFHRIKRKVTKKDEQ